MGSVFGIFWSSRGASSSETSLDGTPTENCSLSGIKPRGRRSGQRVTSVDHLEKLAELQQHINSGSRAELQRCLASFPYDLDAPCPRSQRSVSAQLMGSRGARAPCDEESVSVCLLHVAAGRGRPEAVRLLLAAGASPGVLDSDGESALHHAAAAEPWDYPGRSLPFHHSLRADARHQCLQILCSVMSGSEVLDDILGARSRVDGATPLHRACQAGRTASAATLLDRGADASAVNARGETPMAAALTAGHEAMIDRLLDRTSERGRLEDAVPYLLHSRVQTYTEAPSGDNLNAVLAILEQLRPQAGDRELVMINEPDSLGNTALHYACAGSMVDGRLVVALLAKGSDADLSNKLGRTPLAEFFFAHPRSRTNAANAQSVVLLAAMMTTRPDLLDGRPGHGVGHAGCTVVVGGGPVSTAADLAGVVRDAAGRLPSLGFLCRQTVRRAVRPHRLLASPEVARALPLPGALRDQVACLVDPEGCCAQLVNYLAQGGRTKLPYLDALLFNGGLKEEF